MRWVAFDSKDFKRLKKLENGEERGFYSPFGVGVVIDDYDAFVEAYVRATKEVCEESGSNLRCLCIHHRSSKRNWI
ncbi:MAG: hypothetical protein FWG58_04395 [Methanomassiliicoccaceae archaeon]|nr:hypothetical protein [Methanomassiliicoccaceae archaeon]